MKNIYSQAISLKPIQIFSFTCFMLFYSINFAQTDSSQSYLFASKVSDIMEIQQLEDAEDKTEIASGNKALSIREAPGIITIISKEEIEAMAARDLSDILRMVSGFELIGDVSDLVGISLRGIGTQEGKLLITIDGYPLNELMYGNIPIGNRIPPQCIDRIEIIRGPGSTIYGGWAELGVVNIITKKTEGIQTALSLGVSKGNLSRRNWYFGSQLPINQSGFFSFFGFLGSSFRGNGSWVDFNGNQYEDYSNYSKINQTLLGGRLNYKGLTLKTFYEEYVYNFAVDTASIGTTAAQSGSPQFLMENRFKSFFSELKYEINLDKFSITPKLIYWANKPWNNTLQSSIPLDYYSDPLGQRFLANITSTYDPSDKLNFLGGIEMYQDVGSVAEDAPASTFFFDGEGGLTTRISYFNFNAFAQMIAKFNHFQLTLGGIYQANSIFGDTFIPRFALTGVWKNIHSKFLISRAFRNPNILNISLNRDIKPEQTNVFEWEIGYKFNDRANLVVNTYFIQLNEAIFFLADGSNNDFGRYGNAGFVRTAGVEAEYTLKAKRVQLKFNYSFYRPLESERKGEDIFSIRNFDTGERINDQMLLGITNHKFTSQINYQIKSKWNVGLSAIVLGERYANQLRPITAEVFIQKYNPLLILHLNTSLKNIFNSPIHLSMGIYDLLNSNYSYLQPYAGERSALPSIGREFVLKLGIDLNRF